MDRLSAVFLWACFVGFGFGFPVFASDWPRFRGPNGSGVSPDPNPTPVTWSPTENLRWKVALPGAGVSCPIVVGDRVFVTCYSGYGIQRDEPGNRESLQRHLVCVDRKSGTIRWQKDLPAVQPEDAYRGMGVPEHGYASHTPASDGQRVYAFLGKSGAMACDMEGNVLWQVSLGTQSDPHEWGSASSPILYGNNVIVLAGAESRALVCLDGKTGKEIWRAENEEFGNVWGTPVIAKVDETRSDLVVGVPYELWGFNPDTGKLRWYCEAMETDSFNSSVVFGDGVVFAIEGRGGGSIAVKVGGKGDVTSQNVIWSGGEANRFGTPVYHLGRIYFVSNGIANCMDALTRQTLFQNRLPQPGSTAAAANEPSEAGRGRGGRGGFGGRGGGDYSSPVIADGKVYYVTKSGDMHVFKAADKFESLAVNRVTTENETFSATPAISDGELFFRSDRHLYCVAQPVP